MRRPSGHRLARPAAIYYELQSFLPDVSAAIALAGHVGRAQVHSVGRARPLRNLPSLLSLGTDLALHNMPRSDFRRAESSNANTATVSIPDCDEGIPASDVNNGQARASRQLPQEEQAIVAH
jgi:hypothetical protein